jgi:hypothetical protein
MMRNNRGLAIPFFAALFALALGGCGTLFPATTEPTVAVTTAQPAPRSVLRAVSTEPSVEDRILSLDPDHVTEEEVRTTLAKGPAPRIINVHGGVYPVHLLMESFAQFLTGMGYPESKLRDVGDGSLSRSPYENSDMQAGLVAWYYEHEGLRPMLIGHSQGGIQVVKILHDLAGAFSTELTVYNPLTGEMESRTTIIDPLTGEVRPVVGLSVSYASAVGTGGWSLALPVHWMVVSRIRTIPDTVEEFTGYRIALDLFAWDAPWTTDLKNFHANGKAHVRNVELPAAYSHVFVPGTASLAESKPMRDWINAYDPDDPASSGPMPNGDTSNLLWAADVWHSIKRHWVLEAQRFIKARRAQMGIIRAESQERRG